MKHAKRTLGLLLAAVMLLAALPMSALAKGDAAIELVDIGRVWTVLFANQPVGFEGEVNPNEPGLTDQMELVEQTWTDTTDGHVLSSLAEFDEPALADRGYVYAARLAAKEGYVFADGFRFVYGGTAYPLDEIIYQISGDGKELVVSGFIPETFPLSQIGDVDGSGDITAADALMALQGATSKITMTDGQKAAADVDGDGQVTAADALMILQYATQKINRFPNDPFNLPDDPRGDLDRVIGEAADLLRRAGEEPERFDPEAVEELARVKDAAQQVLEDPGASDDDLRDACGRLLNAIDRVEPRLTPRDRLRNLLNAADDLLRRAEEDPDAFDADDVAELARLADEARPLLEGEEDDDAINAAFDEIEPLLRRLEDGQSGEEDDPWDVFWGLLANCRMQAELTDVFTPESIAALQQVIADAGALEENAENVEPADVWAMCERMQTALDSVETQNTPEALQAYLDFIDENIGEGALGTYTDESVAAVTAALDAARPVAADPDATPDEVAAQFAAIREALDGLEEEFDPWSYFDYLLDMSRDQLDEVTAPDMADIYTAESVDALRQAIADAEAYKQAHLEDADLDEIDALCERMDEAMDGLEYRNTPAALQKKIDDIDDVMMFIEAMYTADSVAALKAALDAARPVAANPDATPDEVAAQFAALAAAQEALEQKSEEEVAWEEFESALGQCQRVLDNPNAFTADSVAAVQQVVNDAKAFKQAHFEDATAEEIGAVIEEMTNVLDELEYQNTPEMLQLVINQMDAFFASPMAELFTEDSIAALKAAVDAARPVAANPDATPDEIAAQIETLQGVFETLELEDNGDDGEPIGGGDGTEDPFED
ncbi:MAG: dockerin type I repeat-containing protein [Acutalibacteraceae bacterium]|jgi:hypothetical protein